MRKDCPKKKGGNGKKNVKCNGCGKQGHVYDDCWDNPKNADKVPEWYKSKKETQAAAEDTQQSRELQVVSWTDYPAFFEEFEDGEEFKEFAMRFDDGNCEGETAALVKESSAHARQKEERCEEEIEEDQSKSARCNGGESSV